MASKPLEEVTLADLVTKDDLKNLVTKDDLKRELSSLRQEFKHELGVVRQEFKREQGSAVNMLMGELGKIAARQEEQSRILARLVAASDGVVR